jgi:hypothetical protein
MDKKEPVDRYFAVNLSVIVYGIILYLKFSYISFMSSRYIMYAFSANIHILQIQNQSEIQVYCALSLPKF